MSDNIVWVYVETGRNGLPCVLGVYATLEGAEQRKHECKERIERMALIGITTKEWAVPHIERWKVLP